jgi:hypothetical protein
MNLQEKKDKELKQKNHELTGMNMIFKSFLKDKLM